MRIKTAFVPLVLFYVLSVTNTFAQLENNRFDRLTESEFKELLQHREAFIPTDLKQDTVLIVRYAADRLERLQLQARKQCYAQHGIDTATIALQTAEDAAANRKTLDKFSKRYPEMLQKELARKGVKSVIVDENQLLATNVPHGKRYWLKTTYISSQESPSQEAWVLSVTNFFYDAQARRNYEVYLPLNNELLDLLP